MPYNPVADVGLPGGFMITGKCHCGKTSFRIDGELPERVTRCTCSICAKRGAPARLLRDAPVTVVDGKNRW